MNGESEINLPPGRGRKARRIVAVPQATIARAGRVAQSLGPAWHVEIEGNIVRLLQGSPAKDEPEDGFARGLRIVP